MTRKTNLDGLAAAPQWIVLFLGAFLTVHLFVLYIWNTAGSVFPIQGTADGNSALSVTAMAAVGVWLCLLVRRSFPAGAPLRPAWTLITLAAAAQAASGLVMQVLGTNWLLNPLVGHAKPELIEQIRCGALIAGGPVRLALLAVGILAALRVLRRFGFWDRPSIADWAVSSIIYLYTLCRFGEAGAASLTGRQTGIEDWIALAGLPILCVLFLGAMLLWRSVVRMGNGPISRCWGAFMCGIFLTGAGELALWVIPHYSHGWPLAITQALTWFPIAALFALAPACQLAAQCRAIKPAGDRTEDMATGVPALAR